MSCLRVSDKDDQLEQSASAQQQQSTTNSSTNNHNTEQKRPMNAFLLFCKRQRSLVREKYPTLENRGITKILGDLWSKLDKEQKSEYTDLARQHKEAFMKANPDFRWCKTPSVSNINDNVNINDTNSMDLMLSNRQQLGAPKPPKKRFLERNDTSFTSNDNNSYVTEVVPYISLDQETLDRVIDKAFSEDPCKCSKPSTHLPTTSLFGATTAATSPSSGTNPTTSSSSGAHTTASSSGTDLTKSSSTPAYYMSTDEPVDFSMNRTINTTRQELIDNLVEKMLADPSEERQKAAPL